MSACFAVVLNGNIEVKYFPFHDSHSADDAEAMADQWRHEAINAVGQEEAERFHLRVVRPKVIFQLQGGAIIECEVDDVDIKAANPMPEGVHLAAFGYNRDRGHCGHWDLDGAELIEYVA